MVFMFFIAIAVSLVLPNTSFKRRSPLKGPIKNSNKPKNNIDSGLAGWDFADLAQPWIGSIR